MNLELPFPDAEPSALDDYVAAIDEELDAAFLDEVDGVLRRLRAERDVKPGAAVA